MVRYLGAENYGILSFAIAFTAIIGPVGDLGLSFISTREVARDKSQTNKYFGNFLAFRLFSVVITISLITIIISFLGKSAKEIIVVNTIGISVIIYSFIQLFFSIFRAYEKFEYEGISGVSQSILMIFGALFGVSASWGVIEFAGLYAFTNLIILIYCLMIYIKKFPFPKLEFDQEFLRPALRNAFPFFLSSLLFTIMLRIDRVIISQVQGNIAVGWYSAAYVFIEIIGIIPSVFATSIFPILSKFHISSIRSLTFAYEKSLKYLTIIGIPVAVGTFLLADKIIFLIYGKEFTNSVLILQILAWMIPVSFVLRFSGTIFASIDRQVDALKFDFIVMVFNLSLNLLLIPTIGYIGASITALISYLIGWGLGYLFLTKKFHRFNVFRIAIRPAIASIFMGAFVVIFRDVTIFILVPISVCFYFLIIIALKTFTDEDLLLFKSILRTRVNLQPFSNNSK